MGNCCETDFNEAQLAFSLTGDTRPISKPKGVLKNQHSKNKHMSVQFAPTPKEVVIKYQRLSEFSRNGSDLGQPLGDSETSDLATIRPLQLRVNRFIGKREIKLEKAQSVIDVIDQYSDEIHRELMRWEDSQRMQFQQHFNGLIPDAPDLGDMLVGHTSEFRESIGGMKAMQNPVRLQTFTRELLDCGFIDEDHFYGQKPGQAQYSGEHISNTS